MNAGMQGIWRKLLVFPLLHSSIFANDADSAIKQSTFFIVKTSKT